MDQHRCDLCQRFVLDFYGSLPRDLAVEQYIRIECKYHKCVSIPRYSTNGVDSGRCPFLDFLVGIDTSERLRARPIYSLTVQRLQFGSEKQVIAFHLVTDLG